MYNKGTFIRGVLKTYKLIEKNQMKHFGGEINGKQDKLRSF